MGGKLYILLVLILLLFSSVASAGYISINDQITASKVDDKLFLDITSTNLGDEASLNVFHEAEFMNTNLTSEVRERLDTQASISSEFEFDLPDNHEGNYPIIIKTHYSDLNSYPFSKLTVIVHGEGGEAKISVKTENTEINRKGTVYFWLENENKEEYELSLRLICPSELSCPDETSSLVLSNEIEKIKFKIGSGSSLPGSSYNVYLIAEYEDGSHNSIISESLVVVKKDTKSISPIYIILGLFFLFFLFFSKYISKKHTRIIVDVVIILLIFVFLLSFFKPQFLFSLTTTSGGDMASHYPTADYMKNNLLPNFKLSGWYQGNYAGFPILHFYFPLPFLIISLFSYIIPFQIAFKIGTLLGVFLLPLSAYYFFRRIDVKFPGPIIASLFTLPFLFMEANSMWGGNIPSVLAGEFSYSLGIAIAFIYFGNLYKGITKNKYLVLNAVLLFLIGLSHDYVLLFAGFASLFFIISKKYKSNLTYLIKLALLSFLFLGFWIIPLISKLSFTTSYADSWIIGSLSKVFPEIFIPFLVCILLIIPFIIFEKKIRQDIRPTYLVFMIGVSFILYLLAPTIGVVDIRFIPFIQISLLLLGAYSLSLIFSLSFKFFKRAKIPLVFLLTFFVLIFIGSQVTYIDQWVPWNYGGFERKASWDTYEDINNYLEGELSDPRVVFEHSQSHNSIGTTRAFELLPYFSGRSTLEGLYMQSSPNAPAIFYIQSLVSKEKSCPFPNFGCSSTNLARALPRLQIFNTKHLIIRSDYVKSLLKFDDSYSKLSSFGLYDIYEANITEGYVGVPEYEPVSFVSSEPQLVSYLWFLNDSLLDVPLIFKKVKDYQEVESFSEIVRVKINNSCKITEKIEEEKISFKTDCVGLPHIIKVSYFPNWKVKGASKVYFVSPGFMLIIPENEEVTIYYGVTFSDLIGKLLTLIGVVLAVLICIRKKFLSHVDKFLKKHQFLILAIIVLVFFVFLFFSDGNDESDVLRKDIAVETKSYTVCNHAGDMRDECFISVGEVTGDHNLCAAEVDKSIKDECYFRIAINYDSSICERIEDEERKKLCKESA